ncbi:DegT/DnrJ/EryC1/StrS family aminotransferase [Paenibacillus sp. SI8]|uniref:DegT/DnrJ/EryC1/StrS family aminotransferase n=1 Tax=unclassified Paenibacillus TaxID=185978 RepID=UPI00346523FD
MSAGQRIYLSSPHMGEEELEFVKEAFTTNWISTVGPHVDQFEKELAAYAGTAGAVALSSGTGAIHLVLKAIGVQEGDIVFVSSLTFAASVNPILYLNATPVLIDSDDSTWNMSAGALKAAFDRAVEEGKLPKAVVVVNLYGQSADYEKIAEICDYYKVPIVEDAAESLGATYRDKMSGSVGQFGIYSFNGNKIITTSGGGAVVSNDVEALKKIKFWATQARDHALHYQHSEVGYNYRLSNVLAGIGRGQLRVLEERVEARRAIYQRYYNALAHLPGVTFMPEANFGRSNRWLTALTIHPEQSGGVSALDCIQMLESMNIESRPVWKPMHLQPLFTGYTYFTDPEMDSVSDRLFKFGICLPSGSNMTEEMQEKVISCMLQLFNK